MFSAMLEIKELNVLDTLEDLHKSPDKAIKIISTQLFGKRDKEEIIETYYKGYVDYSKDFAKRTELVEYLHELHSPGQIINYTEAIWHSDKKNYVVCLSVRSWALCLKNTLGDGRFRKDMYISNEGGDPQPFFIVYWMFSETKEHQAINYM